MTQRTTEMTLKIRDLKDLFSEREFDRSPTRRAVRRYCAHAVGEAKSKLAALRWIGVRTLLIGIVFFAVSLATSTFAQQLLFIPEELRTLASESLIVAGRVVIWQPMDNLVQGWWPQWEEERTLRAIGRIPLRVEGYLPLPAFRSP